MNLLIASASWTHTPAGTMTATPYHYHTIYFDLPPLSSSSFLLSFVCVCYWIVWRPGHAVRVQKNLCEDHKGLQADQSKPLAQQRLCKVSRYARRGGFASSSTVKREKTKKGEQCSVVQTTQQQTPTQGAPGNAHGAKR